MGHCKAHRWNTFRHNLRVSSVTRVADLLPHSPLLHCTLTGQPDGPLLRRQLPKPQPYQYAWVPHKLLRQRAESKFITNFPKACQGFTANLPGRQPLPAGSVDSNTLSPSLCHAGDRNSVQNLPKIGGY